MIHEVMTATANKNSMKEKSARSSWLKLFLELIAVFVGITAGFFVNSYGEKRANLELEHKYLTSISTNLKTDSIEINSLIEDSQNNVDISMRAVSTMQTEELTLDTALAVIQVMAAYNNLNLEDATYKSIVGSGYLGLIMDFETREQIVKYYSFLKDIQLAEEVYNNYITDYVLPFVFKNLDILSAEIVEDFDLGSLEFRNLTTGYYALASQKMALIVTMDSLNHSLKESVSISLN
jgi:hypothetical protein